MFEEIEFIMFRSKIPRIHYNLDNSEKSRELRDYTELLLLSSFEHVTLLIFYEQYICRTGSPMHRQSFDFSTTRVVGYCVIQILRKIELWSDAAAGLSCSYMMILSHKCKS